MGELDELLTDEIRDIARSMITCSHYDNLPDWKFDSYLKEILAKVKQHKDDDFRRALEQSRKGKPLDLSEEDFELFSAIQNDGITKAHQKRLDRPEAGKEAEEIAIKVWNIACAVVDKPSNEYQIVRTNTLKWAGEAIEALVPEEEPEWAGARHLNLDSELEEAKKQERERLFKLLDKDDWRTINKERYAFKEETNET